MNGRPESVAKREVIPHCQRRLLEIDKRVKEGVCREWDGEELTAVLDRPYGERIGGRR